MDTSKDQQSGAGKGQQISDGKDATKQATSGHIENFSSFANSIRPYGFQPKQEKKMNDEELYQFEKEKARKGEYLHASMQGSSQTFVKGKYRCKYHHSHDCPNGLNPGDICWSCHVSCPETT